MKLKNCSVCGDEFTCGVEPGEAACWCAQLPKVMSTFEQDCRCASCLGIVVAQKIEEAILEYSHNEILQIASQYRDQKSLIRNIDYTIESGNYVFSSWYHLKRGECCGNGCRNCPYGLDVG